MTYEQQIRMTVTYLYNMTKCFATSSTYHISYKSIKNSYGMWVGTRSVQDDIREEFYTNYMDKIQALDFDDIKQEVVVMIWESNKKKKYTIDQYEEFIKNALVMPPMEQFEDGSIDEDKWYKQHNIHIVSGNHDIELEYHADNVNEIEYALKEMYEVEKDIRYATTGNTVGSEYPNATWKDILRFYVFNRYCNGTESLQVWIRECIYRFEEKEFINTMKEINKQTSINDEFEVNFSKLDTTDLWKIFDGEERRQAFKEILCQKIDIDELIDKDGKHADKVVITDCSIKPTGDIVGWHYGVDFDKNSEDNQYYIQKYIEEAVNND